MGSRFCKSCGAEIPEGNHVRCPGCGATLPIASEQKNPVLAALLSLVIPGLGQSYNGNALKRDRDLHQPSGSSWVFSSFSFMFTDVFLIVILVLWVAGVYDAWRDAKLINGGKIPAKKHQMLLFFGVAAVVTVILAVVSGIILLFFAMAGLANMYAPVVCIQGEGCITPLEGGAVCNTTNQCMDNARTRMRAHYYADAIHYLDNALARDPQNARALVLKGVAQAESRNLTGAMASLDRAVAADPALAVAHENRGIVQAKSGNNAASLADLEIAAALPGNSSVSWYNLGVARLRDGDADQAAAAFDRALRIDKNCTSCQQMKGEALIALGQYEGALNIIDALNTSGKMGIESGQQRGIALAGLGRYPESCSAFDGAIDAYPFYVTDLWSRACNQTTGRCEPLRATAEPQTESDREFNTRLLASYDADLRQRQDDPDILFKRGEVLTHLMQYPDAISSFDRSLALRPGNAPALNGKGVALFYNGDDSAALEAFELANTADPGFINPWNNGAFVLMKQEKYAEAAKAYQEAISHNDQKTDPHGTGDFLFDTAV